MPRFVLLAHDHPVPHLDLMIERPKSLQSWRLQHIPRADCQLAETIGDHRLAYLDYEGPVSGNRGRVSRWDAGTFEWLTDEPDELRLLLNGARLSGTLQLTACAGSWQCRFVAREHSAEEP